MGTTITLRNIIGETENIFLVGVIPLHRHFDCDIVFFGDKIENIRTFDISDQKSIKKVEKATVTPFKEKTPFSILDYLKDPIIVLDDIASIEDAYIQIKNKLFYTLKFSFLNNFRFESISPNFRRRILIILDNWFETHFSR